MAERRFARFHVHSGTTLEGSRHTAWLAVTPLTMRRTCWRPCTCRPLGQ